MNVDIFIFGLLSLLTFSPLVFGATIEEVRKEALKKLETNLNLVKEANTDVNLLIQLYQNNINVIAYEKRTHGLEIADKTQVEIYKLSVSYGMRASLMNAGPDVEACVEKTHATAQGSYGKHVEEEFDEPSYDLEMNTGTKFRRNLYKWYDLYHNRTANYTSVFNQYNKDITLSKNETEIKLKVKYFETETKDFVDFIYSIIRSAIKDQSELLNNLIVMVNNLRTYSRRVADQTGQQMEKCFSKLFSFFSKTMNLIVN